MSRVGFIGLGVVGTTLARALSQAGISAAAVSTRSHARAEILADELPGCTAYEDAQAVVDNADVVFLTVPDDSIDSVCRQLNWNPEKAAVHCSGAHTVNVLAAAAASGARVGACHPMQTFAGSDLPADHFSGCMFGIEAEDSIRDELAELVRRIGGWTLFLASEDKARYHIAGVLVSNYLVSLFAAGTSLLEDLGVSREDASRGLMPILRGTVHNLGERGLPLALTGPISRGDVGTVRLHLETLARDHRDLLPLYIELGRHTVPVAKRKGTLSETGAAHLEELFSTFDVR